MSMRTYVLIEVAVGKTREVVDSLSSISGMQAVDRVTGPYDVIAVLETEGLNEAGKVVADSIHTIPGVVRTMTCLKMEL